MPIASHSLCYQRTKLCVQVLQVASDTNLGHVGDQGYSEVHPTLGDSLQVSPPPRGTVAEDSTDRSLGRTWEGAVDWRGLRAATGGGRVGRSTCANHVVKLWPPCTPARRSVCVCDFSGEGEMSLKRKWAERPGTRTHLKSLRLAPPKALPFEIPQVPHPACEQC